jgi:hypothetical protein
MPLRKNPPNGWERMKAPSQSIDSVPKVAISGLTLLPFKFPDMPRPSSVETITPDEREHIWRAIDPLSSRINALGGV